VIPQEHPNVACTSIDLASVAAALKPRAIEAVLREAVSGSPDPIVAYRGGHRWVEAYRRIALPESKGTPALLQERGVYLITGGLGDIALNFAEYLARTVHARLVLIGRTAMPDESTWDEYVRSQKTHDITAHRIGRLRRVQALGGEVLIVKADAADRAQLASAFAAADARFGGVNGVIHASGLVTGDAFRTILETDEDAVRRQFQPKVDALTALDDVVRGRELDFCMLVSSLSVLLGGLRYAAYASANSFLDSAARLRNRSSAFPWITVNWDGWIRAEDEASLKAAGKPVAGFVMTGGEGAEAFGRILACDGGTQVVVSTGDLHARIDQWVRLQAAAGAPAEAAPAQASNRLPRPSLQTEFVAPRGDLERSLASVWQDLLGLERVGVNDSFFELGGDSLLGIQLVGRMKLQLGVKVSAVTLYEAPTVAALAALLGADKPGAPTAAVDVSRERGEKRRERKLRQLAAQEVLGA
jgi:aryl carrier-like protein